MRRPPEPSTLGNWIHAIIRTLDARGVDGARIASEAGIAADVLRAGERVPQSAATALWRRAVEVTGDPCFGLQVPRHVTVSTFGALAYALFASRDLRSAFDRLVRYQRLISDAVDVRVDADDERYAIVVDVVSPAGPPFEAIDAFFAVGVRMARGLMGGRHRVDPQRVQLRRPTPPDPEAFHRVFRAPIDFAAPRDVVEWARRDVELPLPDANLELAHQNDQVIARQMASLDRSTVAQRVHAALLDTMPDGPSEDGVARRLGMSTSTLQAALAREGTTYKAVLNTVREDLARRHLADRRYSVKEVAFLLGFADAATFSRAFKRWTGTSPKQYPSATA
jgi:AraC-like DNA-binding protein